MAAYGFVYDQERAVAWIGEGQIHKDGKGGPVIGFERDGQIFDLNDNCIGSLDALDGGTGTSLIRRLIDV